MANKISGAKTSKSSGGSGGASVLVSRAPEGARTCPYCGVPATAALTTQGILSMEIAKKLV
jgi:hypothetical protein